MKAIAIVPGRPETAGVIELPEPPKSDGTMLVRTLSIGLCGTDLEIAIEGYGIPPHGEERLVIGHESLGEVIEAPDGSGFEAGDLVVGVVRRPDPLPCPACMADEWDLCRNGRFIERGIKEHHGYGCERFRIDPRFAVRIDPALGDLGVLLEPMAVVAKAWEQVERMSSKDWFKPRLALVTGAGPVGLLAALLAHQRGFETHVMDLVNEGAKPRLVTDLGAQYHSEHVLDLAFEPDVVIECTGVGTVGGDAALKAAPGAIIALTGFSQSERIVEERMDALIKSLVLGNKVAFGTVSAARRHYDQAADALSRANPDWLARLITRRLAPEEWPVALEKRTEDIKVIVDMTIAT